MMDMQLGVPLLVPRNDLHMNDRADMDRDRGMRDRNRRDVRRRDDRDSRDSRSIRDRDRDRARGRDRDRQGYDRVGDRDYRDRSRDRDRYDPRDSSSFHGRSSDLRADYQRSALYAGYDQGPAERMSSLSDSYGSNASQRSYGDVDYRTMPPAHQVAGETLSRDMADRPSSSQSSRHAEEDQAYGMDDSFDPAFDYDSSRYDDKFAQRWMTDAPTRTILLKGLSPSVDEIDIRAELMLFGKPIKEVRLMKHRDSGASRGFAFVEFQNTLDAKQWMEQNQGRLLLTSKDSSKSKNPIKMFYSYTKTDWVCKKCGVRNFKRRDFCFKCRLSREKAALDESETDGQDEVGSNPCNTIILQGLDALTTEENILAALRTISEITPKNIRVIYDTQTGTSRGFAFIELGSIQESTIMLAVIKQHEPLEIDGKGISAAYAKNTFSTVMATMTQQAAWTQAQWDEYYRQQGYDPSYYGQQSYYDQQYDYSQYYNTATTSASVSGGQQTQTDSTNAAAAVAQAAIQQAQAVKKQNDYQKQVSDQIKQSMATTTTTTTTSTVTISAESVPATTETTSTTPQPGYPNENGEYTVYSVPDVSTYQYEETSGYYYDPGTGLYYDANSQYYYNSQTSQFLYWDGERQTYLPAPTDAQPGQGGEPGRKEDKKEKVKIAKKIAKDMEKWAKTLNAQKEAMKEDFKRTMQMANSRQERESASADAGFAVLEKKSVMDKMPGTPPAADKGFIAPPPLGASASPAVAAKAEEGALVASYGGDSESEEEDENPGPLNEDKLTDWSKMACLLCKRQFPNKDVLQKHNSLSDLHKKNLEELRSKHARTQQQYRDRAKERRDKYGTSDPPRRKARRPEPPPMFEQPTVQGLHDDNKGNQLLQKMGWSQGQGLGRSNQGITDPIMATRRQAQAGLGASGSKVTNHDPGATYKDNARRASFARYTESE